jgi:hypothetical protein
MSIRIECDRVGCGDSFDVGSEASWSNSPKSVREFALRDDPTLGGLIYVYLPQGWQVDRVGHDEVMHCPDHAAEC